MIDEYGAAVYRDLSFYHGIDLVEVIEGRGPAPFFVVPLVAGLPDTSMLAAMRAGGLDHLGWGEDRQIAALTYDALALNTEASGNWKNKPPELPRWPRPDAKASGRSTASSGRKSKKKATVKSVFAMFTS